GGEAAPFPRAEDARDDVEGDQALGGRLLAIDGEGDPGTTEQRFCFFAFALEFGELLRLQPVMHGAVGLAHALASSVHLVECGGHTTPWPRGGVCPASGSCAKNKDSPIE